MEPVRDLAIVLRSIPYEERHRIVTALTESQGVISALARNAIQSRRFGGALDLFSASEWTWVGKPHAELYRLDEATIRRSFNGIRNQFERLSLASVLNELLLRMAPKHQAAPELFKLHSNALAFLEEEKNEFSLVGFLNLYILKLLLWSGQIPRLERCLVCEKSKVELPGEEQVSFQIQEAGWLCSACLMSQKRQNTYPISVESLSELEAALQEPIRHGILKIKSDESTQSTQRDFFKIIEAYLLYHVPGMDQKQTLKGLRFLGL